MNFTKVRNRVQKYAGGQTLARIAAEIGIGSLPIAGEIMDAIGVVKGIATGNYAEAIMSAVSLVVPGLPGGALKAGSKALKSMDTLTDTAKATIKKHSDDIKKVAGILEKPKHSMNEALEVLEVRKKSGALKRNTSKIGGKAFQEADIDGRNLTPIQEGFSIQKGRPVRNSDGAFAPIDPTFKGYDAETIYDQVISDILGDQSGSKIRTWERLASEGDVTAQKYLKAAQELEEAIRTGNLDKLPRFDPTWGGTPKAEHIITAMAQDEPTKGLLGSGYHATRVIENYDPARMSGSGNMLFTGDTVKSVIGYNNMNVKKLESIIDGLPNGKEKADAEAALKFVKEFDDVYFRHGQKEISVLTDKLPVAAYQDAQFEDYEKAREILSLIGGQDLYTVGSIRPAIFKVPNANNILVVRGNGAHFEDLSPLSRQNYDIPGNGRDMIYPKSGFKRVAASNLGGASLDPLFQHKDFKQYLLAMRLEDLFNRVRMQTSAVRRGSGFVLGMKSGGKLNYFNY